jgi:site-specific recombinase XerD
MAISKRKPGALAAHVEGFQSYLLGLGYTPGTVRGQMRVLGHLGRWMEGRGLRPVDLTLSEVDAFVAEACRERGLHRADHRTAVQVLEHLIQEGVAPVPVERPESELERFLGAYREWMFHERGLAEATVQRYENTARRFLFQRATGDVGPAVGVTSVEVNSFLLAESARCSVGAAKGRVAELRSLLRYLFVRGLTATGLAAAVPPVAGWHNTGIPPTLSPGDVQALLDSCDRGRPNGIRDLAILTLVARLGLRSIEVSRMELGDVHWRTGQITVRGKARRIDTMPLPVEVGEAVAAYLADARPSVGPGQRRLFLTGRAPRSPIHADLVSDVVQRACLRAGLAPVGAHRLRHALARQMVAEGVVLTDISQVLRHRDLATTAIYAKVDLDSLRMVARPWPGLCPALAAAIGGAEQ